MLRAGIDGRARLVAAWSFDAGLALFVVLLTVPLVREVAVLQGGALVRVAVANAVVHAGVLVLRRASPLGTAAVAGATALVHVGLGLPVAFLGPGVLVVLFTVAAQRGRRRSVPVLALAVVVLVGGMLVVEERPAWDSMALFVVLLCASWLLGDLSRRRQEEARLHAERARQLEEAREELARHAVTQERLRIARELHDVVAHSMTGIAVHAGTARLALDSDPDLARRSLGVVEHTVRDTLAELRHLLGVLRDGDEAADLAPLPGLDGVNDLVAHAVDAGLTVDVAVDGEPRDPVPAGLELAVHRIVQEALTNVVRHAAADRARVELRHTAEAIEVRVTDDGSGGRVAGRGGHGLVGMAERVAMFGGELQVGPVDGSGRGWRVEARLPYPEGER